MDYKELCLAAEEYMQLQDKRIKGTATAEDDARMDVLVDYYFEWLQLEQDKVLMKANEVPEGWW